MATKTCEVDVTQFAIEFTREMLNTEAMFTMDMNCQRIHMHLLSNLAPEIAGKMKHRLEGRMTWSTYVDKELNRVHSGLSDTGLMVIAVFNVNKPMKLFGEVEIKPKHGAIILATENPSKSLVSIMEQKKLFS